ncbi:hypothetical protein DFJ74DRAFT_653542 [Hyaloraphidium curvatum]|nr:hypothetical protein DFJ74DRAFT_653542 [Hyaloraphidium curvatum]
MEVDEEGSDGEDEDFEDDEGSEDGGAGGGLPVLALEDVQGLVALAGQAGAAGLLPPGMQEILAGAAAQAGMGFDSDDEGMEGEAELQMMQEAAMDLDAAFPPGGPGSGAGEAGAAQPAGTPPKEEPVAVAVQEQEQPASPSPPGPLSADVGSLEVPDFEPPPPPPFGSEPPRSRLDMLLEWDLKQWKQLRSLLRELYIGTFVVTGDEYKAMLGLKYAANYVVTGPSYVLLDREAPLSVFLLAVQLFTVPTVAQKVMQHPTRNFFAEFLTLLKSIYLCNLPTSGITMEKFRQIYLRTWQAHPDSYSPHQLALKMDQNRTRGVGHLFLNVRYLLAAAPQAFGAGYVANMQWLLSTLTPWQGMNPQKRAAVMHVEFENDWADSVTAARNAAELIQVAAHCFAPASDGEPGTTKLDPFAPDSWRVMLHAVRFAYTAAYRWCQAENPRDPLASDQPRVLESTMSFLHPLHWMLAQLLAKMQQIAALRSARGAKPGALGIGAETEPEGRLRVWKQVFDLEAAPGTEVPRIKLMNLQRVVLKPVRVQAFVAQIRANLWVRNGDAMRMQAFHYKYESLRELGYDQDLTVIQAALCVMEPEGVLQTMANAFNLDWWLRGRSATSARLHGMEPRQMNVLAEEFMELLIFLLTERTAAAALSYEEVARREIRHHLAFQPNGMTYSALVKRVSDRATESATDENLEPQFERILKSMARFKEPDATREYGVYELHDGEFDAVDPWFWHYSRNHRAEVAEILKKRASAKKGIHVPALLPVPPNTPFSHLADLVHDKHFASVMFFTIWNCTKRADAKVRVAKDVKTWSAEDIRECGHSSGILDASLHLLLVACQEEVEGYASSVSRRRGINARKAGFMANATSCEFEVPLPTGDKLVKKTLLSLLLELIEAFGGGVTLSGSTKLKAKEASAGFVEESTVADFVPRMYWIVQRIEEWGSDEARTAVAEWRIRVVESQEDRGGADEKPKELTDVDKKRQAAKDRQAAIMAQMKAQQQQFMVSHGFGGPESEEEDDDMDLQADDGAPAEDSLRERAWRFPAGTCIVCQEDADKGSELYGMLAFAQSSRLVRPLNPAEPDEATAALAGVVHLPSSLDEDAGPASGSNLSKEYLARQTFGARADICVSTCGHIMHSKCFTSFMQSVTQRLTQHRERNHPEQGPKDFMCPMCKSLGNMLLPVVASVKTEKVNVVADDSKGAAHSKGKEDHVGQFTTWSQGVVHQRDFLGKLRSGAASPRMDAGPPTTRARAARAGSSSGSSAGPLASSPPTLGFRELFGRALGQIIPGLFRGSRAESGAGDGAPAESKGEALRFAYNARVVNVLKDIKAKIRILPRTADTMDLMETLWSCFAYTVKCYETAARGTGRAAGEPLWHRGQPSIWVSQLSANQVTLLRLLGETILGYANMLMTDDDPNVSTEPEVVEAQMRERSAALVGAIFAGIIAKPSLPAEPLLLRDGLDIFAEVSSTVIPATANPLSEDDDMWQWTRLIYLIDIVRTAANIAHLVGDVRATLEMEGEAFDGPAFPAKDLVQWVAGLIGMSSAVTQIGSVAEASLAKLFQALLLPSLRRYALLLHARFGVVPEGQDGSTPSPVSPTASSAGHHDGEFARLTTFLRLPTLAEVCAHLLGHGSAAGEPGDPTLTRIVSSWCAHYRDWTRSPSSWTIAIADPTIPQLVALPQQLTLLIESSIAFVCGKCGTTPTDPALCLLCGQYVCSQSMCCAENRQGECNQHMQNCGGETGIFFIVKRGAILYLHRGNGTFVPMPYLDTHGESDVGLKRGRPAFFNAKRYADIRKTWLTLQIPQLIARKVESSYDVGGWGAF